MEFLDTNVLVYAASDKAADQEKAGVARDLLRRDPNQFAISLQVLQEFYVAARAPRKLALRVADPNPCWVAAASYSLSAQTRTSPASSIST